MTEGATYPEWGIYQSMDLDIRASWHGTYQSQITADATARKRIKVKIIARGCYREQIFHEELRFFDEKNCPGYLP